MTLRNKEQLFINRTEKKHKCLSTVLNNWADWCAFDFFHLAWKTDTKWKNQKVKIHEAHLKIVKLFSSCWVPLTWTSFHHTLKTPIDFAVACPLCFHFSNILSSISPLEASVTLRVSSASQREFALLSVALKTPLCLKNRFCSYTNYIFNFFRRKNCKSHSSHCVLEQVEAPKQL